MDVDSSSDDSSSDDDSSSGDDMETDIERHVRELDYSLERQLDLRISKKFETYDARVAAAAVEALGRLADESDNDANCAAIADTGGIGPLVGFVALYDSAEGQFWAARALRKIASKNTAKRSRSSRPAVSRCSWISWQTARAKARRRPRGRCRTSPVTLPTTRL